MTIEIHGANSNGCQNIFSCFFSSEVKEQASIHGNMKESNRQPAKPKQVHVRCKNLIDKLTFSEVAIRTHEAGMWEAWKLCLSNSKS
jgi:hypothetical protein